MPRSLPKRWPFSSTRSWPRCLDPTAAPKCRLSPCLRGEGSGPPLQLTGKIDRLVQTGDSVLILDYKSNRPPPRDVAAVAESYLLQLAAYASAVSAIFPETQVRAALLWTDGARIMEIPKALLDEHAQRLWTLDPASLDA